MMECIANPFPLQKSFYWAPWETFGFVLVVTLLLAAGVRFLPGFWKVVPALLMICVIWYAGHDYVETEYDVYRAKQMVDEADFDEGEIFVLKDAGATVIAKRTELGSPCNEGFLVKTDPENAVWDFSDGYPFSPLDHYYSQERQRSLYDMCRSQDYIRIGMEGAVSGKQNVSGCSIKGEDLKFARPGDQEAVGFSFIWCRNLAPYRSYCEADGISVLRSGRRPL